MNSPIDTLFDSLKWTATDPPVAAGTDTVPFVTHEATLEFCGHRIRTYRLSDGGRIFNKEDFEAAFGALGGDL